MHPPDVDDIKTHDVNNGLRNLLRWLGYHDVRIVDSTERKNRAMIMSAFIYLIFEVAYAIFSIMALFKYITPNNIACFHGKSKSPYFPCS